MGYLINSGSGFLSNAVQIVSNKKSYLLNTTGYGAVDNIRIGYDDFGTRVYSDNGSIESYGCAAETMQDLKQLSQQIICNLHCKVQKCQHTFLY